MQSYQISAEFNILDKIRINKLKEQFTNKTIVIIGDLMLDGYFRGDVKRVSPEAPVPVVEVDNEFFRFSKCS